MLFGKLEFLPAKGQPEAMAEPTRSAIQTLDLQDVFVAEIDPTLADTATFCEHYAVTLDVSANCVIVEAKRADRVWHAACMILATDKVDVSGIVRRFLDAIKTSFASMNSATSLTGMQYGGITPIGLPSEWPILVDARVAGSNLLVIGSGLRNSKILASGQVIAELPNATVLDIAKDTSL